ncbi:MAG: excinuclease ABC subunit UvrA [Lachnospiraceae bacterium]|uniref:excinuclease ABC subunit UvrA n=1 Tax=Galactobacillus timonensis TaxID=2041840 RepID=UPI0023F4AD80|nr:excinuclease ABC subunit UvrA [Galactobacillus timonensis]MDD7086454.1 excinuclease ABC subunit UvrA [Galactobacillus timonensis]MDY5223290.1 excinuclease ABC subunit UvrA [Lachnospiraceae bacterium]
MEQKWIEIRGAKENNLKNISLNIPRNKMVVMTGLSGSGKTSLAFDTIYAEGQRRYVESLSAYARQFLGGVDKPDVESITGLSPAISIDQKTTSNNPRSTVGTVTEIYDYLRLLYARCGTPYCPNHNIPIQGQTITEMVNAVWKYPEGTKLTIMAPIIHDRKGAFKDRFQSLIKEGYVRVRVDGEMKMLEDDIELDKNKRHNIDVVVDRIVKKEDVRSRLSDSMETALKLTDGKVIVLANDEENLYSSTYACKICGFSVPNLEPRLFSFNAPLGACDVCRGLGFTEEVDLSLLIPDDSLSINQGGIRYFKNMVNTDVIEWQTFEILCNAYKIPLDQPIKKLTKKQMQIILHGSDKPVRYTITTSSGNEYKRFDYIEGIQDLIERRYAQSTSPMFRDWYHSFMVESPCPKCHGQRLNEQALSVRVGDKNIMQFTAMSVTQALTWLDGLKLSEEKTKIAEMVIKEIRSRLQFLKDVGLEYLTLDRLAGTLSGGEAQRIRLATQIGSKLSGVLYVLDEPSIGLHQRDNAKLIHTLKEMRDLGNSLIIVEHDEETMLASDWIVDIGPGAGIHGGQVMFNGTPQDLLKCDHSITGDYLSGRKMIPVPKLRRKGNGKFVEIFGASEHNLKHIDVKFPLGKLIVVTGVSGSGKSTLVNEIFTKAVQKNIGLMKRVRPGKFDKITGLKNIDKIVQIDQSPIGRTPRSNPATYTGVFDDIRAVFAETPEAKLRGYDKGRFSFNTKGGRCEACQGDGVKVISMNFLPDVYVPCEVCHGKRYNEETLQVTFKGKNIFDVLDMSIEEALKLFENHPKIKNKLQTLVDVGLGYLKVGQSSTTLSGGEAQRVKLASELQKKATGKTVYVLDEPTTGLHTDDVNRLIAILQRIVDSGNTVLVIEHNLDVIKCADWIIDLGPEGGDGGGTIVAQGTPEEVAENPDSWTGKYLKKALEWAKEHETK